MTHYKQFLQGLLSKGYINTFLAWEGGGAKKLINNRKQIDLIDNKM